MVRPLAATATPQRYVMLGRRNERILPSVLASIGETPCVELSRIGATTSGRIVAKLEILNPGASKKDRVALQIIEDAEREGTLRPGQTVIEHTSGNTGTGAAIVCTARRYPFLAVMSRGNSVERARMMAALGAEVILIEQDPGSRQGQVSGKDWELVEQATVALARERNAFRLAQFENSGNFRAHYLHTGPEILAQTGGHFDVFCDFVGSGGTFGGCTAAFKEFSPSIKCYAVEPSGARVLAGHPVTDEAHRIQGGGYCRTNLRFVDEARIDGYVGVTDEEAMNAARRLAREEGLFCGFSSGANLAAALQLLRSVQGGATIVIVLNDSGLKYLSTDLWV